MKKIILLLISVFLIFAMSNTAFAAIGYVDYGYISKNYPLAQKYTQTLKSKSDAIVNYAKQKDSQVKAAATASEKEKIRKEGIAQVQTKQKELKTLKERYETELNSKVTAAAEKVRIQKGLDMIVKKDARVTGGVNCTNEILTILKSQNTSGK